MKYLRDNGYHIITFADLVNCLNNVGKLPSKPVILSFDDGWEDQFAYALPRLEEYHYIATFFVVTNFVGARGFVSWSKLRTTVAEGMKIGSHSRSHPYLDKIDNPGTLWDQIYTSKQILESQLGVAVDEFAYPYGSYNAVTLILSRYGCDLLWLPIFIPSAMIVRKFDHETKPRESIKFVTTKNVAV